MIETNGLQAVATTTGPLHALPDHPEQWTTSHTGHADTAPRTAGHADEHPARSKEHSS